MFSIRIKYFILLLVLTIAFACDASIVSAGVENQDVQESILGPSCTNDTSGLPQCYKIIQNLEVCRFTRHNLQLENTWLNWTTGIQAINTQVTVSGLGIKEPPLPHDTAHKYKYAYVVISDENIPVGPTVYLSGSIKGLEVQAVCITVWYVTNSQGREPPVIHIKNRKLNAGDNKTETVGFIGSIVNSTHGEWRQANFHACVWPQSEIIFQVEKTSNDTGVAVIGNIIVTHSKLPCSCTRKYNGMPACSFNTNWCGSYTNGSSVGDLPWLLGTQLEPNMDGYYNIDRDVPLKPGRPLDGHFAYTDIANDMNTKTGSMSCLLGQLHSSQMSEVCITFNYATTGKRPQRMWIYNRFKEGGKITRRLLGQLTDMTKGKWREVTYTSKTMTMEQQTNFTRLSYIEFEVEKVDSYSYFALDNVRISKREMFTPKPTTDETTPATITRSPTTTTLLLGGTNAGPQLLLKANSPHRTFTKTPPITTTTTTSVTARPTASAMTPETSTTSAMTPETPTTPAMTPETPTTLAMTPEIHTTSAMTTETPTASAMTPEIPTTSAMTTETPTTSAMTPEIPTTSAMTTETPTASAMTPEIPTTSAMTTETLTTSAMTTEIPTISVMTTETPTTSAMVTETPTTSAMTTETPTTSAMTPEMPTASAMTTETPTTSAMTPEMPTTSATTITRPVTLTTTSYAFSTTGTTPTTLNTTPTTLNTTPTTLNTTPTTLNTTPTPRSTTPTPRSTTPTPRSTTPRSTTPTPRSTTPTPRSTTPTPRSNTSTTLNTTPTPRSTTPTPRSTTPTPRSNTSTTLSTTPSTTHTTTRTIPVTVLSATTSNSISTNSQPRILSTNFTPASSTFPPQGMMTTPSNSTSFIPICPAVSSPLRRCSAGKHSICCVKFHVVKAKEMSYNTEWTVNEPNGGDSELSFNAFSTHNVDRNRTVQPTIGLGNMTAPHPVVLSLEYKRRSNAKLWVTLFTRNKGAMSNQRFVIFDDDKNGTELNAERQSEWQFKALTLGRAVILEKVEFQASVGSDNQTATDCKDCIRIRNVAIGQIISGTQLLPPVKSPPRQESSTSYDTPILIALITVSAVGFIVSLVVFVVLIVYKKRDNIRKKKKESETDHLWVEEKYQAEMYMKILRQCEEMVQGSGVVKFSEDMMW